jgi:hypothetical protein
MAKPVLFNGTLKQNAVLQALYNMIISQEVFAGNINLKGTLVEKFRLDGTLYGDTKLFISTDIGKLTDFPNASENLLTKRNPKAPKTQAVTIDRFKQTAITIDGVKLKQAFSSADIYGAFVAVCIQWLRDSMKVLNVTLINTFIGTVVTEATRNTIEVEFPAEPDGTDVQELRQYRSYQAELIGASIADVAVDLQDALRDFNDYGFLRAYDLSNFMIVWNKRWANMIRHISLPKIFNKDEVIGKEMESVTINDRYFGTILTSSGTADGTTVRTLVDRVLTVDNEEKQFFPGDILPSGTTYNKDEAYTVDENIIAKIVHKRAVPFMSALVVESEFYNPKDLDRTHYLTWGYSEPTYLKEYPIIVFEAKYEEAPVTPES